MSHEVFGCAETDTILAASQIMAKHNIGALVVLREGSLAGIVSERDVVAKVVAKKLDVQSVLVKDVMTRNVQTLPLDASLLDITRLMNKYHFRHIVIVDDGKVVGILTAKDVIDMVSG
ncbi:MAG: CBS domain-containing protein [Nanoarchaeota archaeon]